MLFLKTIVLTGGGTAGHVTPNLALIPKLQKEGYRVIYIGTENGMERGLIEKTGIPYYYVSTGKLRRYMSKENFTDMFKVLKGIAQARKIIKKIKPDIVFSKGGFVAVPVVIGAKMNGVTVIAHESDMTPGLANKIAMPFAKQVCTTFPETVKYIPKGKGINTGSPIREELFCGDRKKGLKICSFTDTKPVLMMMGGSLGSQKINKVLRESLDGILKNYQLVHICGKGNMENINKLGYKQFEYLSEDLTHVLAASDCVISRAGSNSISEFLALKKPMLLIPLSENASRGDQILNAKSFENQGFALVLKEEGMNKESLLNGIGELFMKKNTLISAMEKSPVSNGVENVMKIIRKYI
jgi:UDP-N-acetylglucosamine--N-acetylmuramyl-(pentapeptide) pyrophosphoryl-undecaprenol N-acetylglucosamine transferase